MSPYKTCINCHFHVTAWPTCVYVSYSIRRGMQSMSEKYASFSPFSWITMKVSPSENWAFLRSNTPFSFCNAWLVTQSSVGYYSSLLRDEAVVVWWWKRPLDLSGYPHGCRIDLGHGKAASPHPKIGLAYGLGLWKFSNMKDTETAAFVILAFK